MWRLPARLLVLPILACVAFGVMRLQAAPDQAPPSPPPSQAPPTPAPVTPTPTAIPTQLLRPWTPPTPSSTPSPVPTVTTTPTTPQVPELPPDAMPQIVSVMLPTNVVHSGETVTGEVIASSNVASVEVSVAGYSEAMQKVAPGHFTLSVVVPRLPFFLRNHTYTLVVSAHNSRGDTVTQSVPVTLR